MHITIAASLLAGALLAGAVPSVALQPDPIPPAGSKPAAEQRALLEAYVECVRGASTHRDARGARGACAAERSAYGATLPAEWVESLLEQVDAGPRPAALP